MDVSKGISNAFNLKFEIMLMQVRRSLACECCGADAANLPPRIRDEVLALSLFNALAGASLAGSAG